MGTYGLGKGDIAGALLQALNDLEGDIYQKDLIEVLEEIKKYPYVTDKIYSKKHIKDFNKWCKSLDLQI